VERLELIRFLQVTQAGGGARSSSPADQRRDGPPLNLCLPAGRPALRRRHSSSSCSAVSRRPSSR